jgi:SAM-dependent methyltransferase
MNKLLIFILFALATPAIWLTAGRQQAQTGSASQSPAGAAPKPIYETRADHDPDGIGKFYMGREIAHVMGYQGAEWLERPERIEEERPDQVVEQMKLKPADVVADVGAGTGYFSFRISRVVKQGKVFAVDIQPEMLAVVEKRKKE